MFVGFISKHRTWDQVFDLFETNRWRRIGEKVEEEIAGTERRTFVQGWFTWWSVNQN